MRIVARHFETGQWTGIDLDGPAIAEISPGDGPGEIATEDEWVAPAFWDIQTNGRWGISFASPELTEDQVASIVLAQAGLGTARLLPTLIIAPRESLIHGLRDDRLGLRSMARGRRWSEFIWKGRGSPGRMGIEAAHPIASVRDPSLDEFEAVQEAANRR